MTNYNLPSADHLAEGVNPIFDVIANEYDARDASLVEIGATTVIQLLKESALDLLDKVVEQAEAVGVPAEEAEYHFDVVYGGLTDILTPRLEAMHAAVLVAQGAEDEEEVEEEDDTDEGMSTSEIDDLIEGLFASLIGAEAAAGLRSIVDEKRAEEEEAEVEEDEDDYDEEQAAKDFEEFMAAMFGTRV